MNKAVAVLPSHLDPECYRALNPDLQVMTDAELFRHFHAHGKHEGRIGSRFSLREHFGELLSGCYEALEIGPDMSPTIRGPAVKYFDLLDEDAIRQRALARGVVNIAEPPHIDFVSPTGDLSIVTGTYDAVVSSHCIEHQPDLIQHLKDVGRLLKPGGKYALWAPDKRYCFDQSLAESTIADVLQAHAECRKVHNLATIVQNRALTTHNDAARHWADDHTDPGRWSGIAERAQMAIREFVETKGAYLDAHAWRVTPDSFRFLIDQLVEMGMSPLRIDDVFYTGRGANEFAAVLNRL